MAGKFYITLLPELVTFKGDYRTARRDAEEESFQDNPKHILIYFLPAHPLRV